MRITVDFANWLVDRAAGRLNSGTLTIHPESDLVLVAIPFQREAFQPAENTVAVANPLPETVVSASGEARRATLATSTGEVLAEVAVRAVDDPDVQQGDVIVDRTDFHRGGRCVLERVTLTVPLQS